MSTELDIYLREREVSESDFGDLIGRDRSMVNKLRRGRLRPTLDLAASIERVTGGAVPIKSWVATEQAAA